LCLNSTDKSQSDKSRTEKLAPNMSGMKSVLLRTVRRGLEAKPTFLATANTGLRITASPFCLQADEKQDFLEVFSDLKKELSFDLMPKDLTPLISNHMERCIQYNVPNGKLNRGYAVLSTYQLLASKEDLTQENIRLAAILGWTVELLQAFFLVADDIMDHSESRRGHPCWYKVEDIGLTAFNDSILLEACIYSVLRKHFKGMPYYNDLLDVMLETTKYTIMGQYLDLSSAQTFARKQGSVDSLHHFTLERHKAIVKYKTSYYSFYLPVALAMRMAGTQDEKLFKWAKRILLDMGHYFQVQDDYLDCFGDPAVTGKQGTDIQDGKCSWLVAVALTRVPQEKKVELAARYGSSAVEDVAWVKELYTDIGIQKIYTKYEEDFYEDITEMIQKIEGDTHTQKVFTNILDRIYKREK